MFWRRRGSGQFEKFTERTRRLLSLSQEEAQHFNHGYVGTGHILIALVRETDGVAARSVGVHGVEYDVSAGVGALRGILRGYGLAVCST